MSRSWIRRLPLVAAAATLACGGAQEAPPPAPTPEPTPEPSARIYALVAPIVEGQEDAFREMVAAITGDRAEQHAEAYEALGVDAEMVWHQKTPDGSAAVVYLEGRDLDTLFDRELASEDPHVQWFVEQVAAIHGTPTDQPPPPNELVFDGVVSGVEGETGHYALAAPILPGKEAAFEEFIDELDGERRAQWEEARRAQGIARESVWLQKTPAGSFAVVHFEAIDPEGVLARMSAESDREYDQWFRQKLDEIHGISGDPPPPNERVK